MNSSSVSNGKKVRRGRKRMPSPITVNLESNTMIVHARGSNCIFDYDPDLLNNLSQHNWVSIGDGSNRTPIAYFRENGKGGKVSSISIIRFVFGKYLDGAITGISFANGNSCDFRKENIHFFTEGENNGLVFRTIKKTYNGKTETKGNPSKITIDLESGTMVVHAKGADCILDYSQEVYEKVSQHRWTSEKNKSAFTRLYNNGESEKIYLKSIIFGGYENGGEAEIVFINGDKHDLRKENVRFIKKGKKDDSAVARCSKFPIAKPGRKRNPSKITINLESGTMVIHAKGAECILDYNQEVYEKVSQYNWAGARNKILHTYFSKNGVFKYYSLATILFKEYFDGEMPNIRFLNGDKNDFRRKNLHFT